MKMVVLILGTALALPGLIVSAAAKDSKFVGVWEGKHGTPVYTKLVFHKDQSVTYCEVSSCHYVNCRGMKMEGSTSGKFSHTSPLGKWAFNRVSQDEIEATFTNSAGDVSKAFYEPE